MICVRCDGLLVDGDDEYGEMWRCLNCGERMPKFLTADGRQAYITKCRATRAARLLSIQDVKRHAMAALSTDLSVHDGSSLSLALKETDAKLDELLWVRKRLVMAVGATT